MDYILNSPASNKNSLRGILMNRLPFLNQHIAYCHGQMNLPHHTACPPVGVAQNRVCLWWSSHLCSYLRTCKITSYFFRFLDKTISKQTINFIKHAGMEDQLHDDPHQTAWLLCMSESAPFKHLYCGLISSYKVVVNIVAGQRS